MSFLLGHTAELHLGVVHAVWNVLLPVGSVLPADVCGTFALYRLFFFVLGAKDVLMLYKHANMFPEKMASSRMCWFLRFPGCSVDCGRQSRLFESRPR